MSEDKKNNEVESVEIEAPSSELSKKAGQLSFLEKAGEFIQGKAKIFIIAFGVIAVAILGWIGYQKFIVEPEDIKTAESLYPEESFMVDQQDWYAVINGDSLQTTQGLVAKSKKFEGYAGGEIANYNLGIAYLNNGQPQEALVAFQKVTFEDENLATLALGAMGDASMDLEKYADAISYYEQAYKRRPKNEMTAPLYMFKLANARELTQKYDEAAKLYNDLIQNFPYSSLVAEAEKNLVFVNAGTSIYELK